MFEAELVELKNITKRLEDEDAALLYQSQQWKYAFDAIPDAVFITNENFDIKFANKAFVKRFNTTHDELINTKCHVLVHNVDEPNACVCKGKNGEPRCYGEVYSNRTRRWYLFDRAPIHDSNGLLLGHINVLRDVTEEKASNEARACAEQQLKKSDERVRNKLRTKLESMVKNPSDIKILVVDDDEVIRTVTSEFLGLDGYQVITAESGRQALKLYELEKPDLVIVDLILPDISGQQVIKEINTAANNTIPIIILSGSINIGDIAMVFEDCNCDYIMKPITREILSTRVKRNLLSIELFNQRKLVYDFLGL